MVHRQAHAGVGSQQVDFTDNHQKIPIGWSIVMGKGLNRILAKTARPKIENKTNYPLLHHQVRRSGFQRRILKRGRNTKEFKRRMFKTGRSPEGFKRRILKDGRSTKGFKIGILKRGRSTEGFWHPQAHSPIPGQVRESGTKNVLKFSFCILLQYIGKSLEFFVTCF